MAQKSLDIDYITLRKIRAVNHTNNTNPTKNYILATNGRGDCDWTNTIENIATYGAYLGSAFMVVGGYGENALAYDRDGIHWYGSSNGANLFYNGQALCGAWNGVLWVVGGQSFDPSGGPILIYSSDGITWTDNSGADALFGIGGQCNAVAWDGEKWLAGGRLGGATINPMALFHSSDGITWSRVNTDIFFPTFICSALAWNGSVWLMGVGNGCDGGITLSLDGITWLNNGTELFPTCTSIAWNGRLWVATGNYESSDVPSINTSTDGVNWTLSPSSGTVFPAICNSVAWNGSLWVAAGNSDGSEGSSTLAYSKDGHTWTPSVNGLTFFPAVCNSVIWNGSLWVAGGSSQPLQPGEVIPILPALGTRSTTVQPLAYSSDGMTWFPSIPETSQLFQVNFVASNQVLPYIGINKTGPVLHQEPGPGGRVVYDTSGQNLYISRILKIEEPSTESGSGTVIVRGDVLPETTNMYSLGSSTHRWKDFHLDGASIYIGNTGIINANNNGAIGINYSDPSSNELIGLEVGKASYFHESIGINTAPFTTFSNNDSGIIVNYPALLIEGITQLGVTEPQFMSVYSNNNTTVVNGYIYGDVSDGSISIGYNHQNARPQFNVNGTTNYAFGTSKMTMLEDTIITYVDASSSSTTGPGTVGWSVIGNGLGNPASIGIGTTQPSSLYALDISGASHVSGYTTVDGSLNSFSISTGTISSTTLYASTSALIDGALTSANISTGAISSTTLYADTSAYINGALTSANISTGAISSTTVYASTSVTAGNVSINTSGLTTSQTGLTLTTTNGTGNSVSLDSSGFYPIVNNSVNLGTSDFQWNNLYVNNFTTTTLNANELNVESINPGTFFTDSTTISGEFGVQSYSQFTGTLLFTLNGAGGGGGAPSIGPTFGGGGGGAGGTLQGNFNFTTPTDISFNFTVGSGGIGGYRFDNNYQYYQDGTPAIFSSFSITINSTSYVISENPAQGGFLNESITTGVGGRGGYFTIPPALSSFITEVSGGDGMNGGGFGPDSGGQGGASSTVFYGNGGTGGSILINFGTGTETPTPGLNGQGAYCVYTVNGTSNNNTFNYIFANTSTAIQNATVTTASIQNVTINTASIQTASIPNLIGQSTVTYSMGNIQNNSSPVVLQNPPFGNGLYSVLVSTLDTQNQPNDSIRCCIGLIAYWTNTRWAYGGNVSYMPSSGFSNNSVLLSISQPGYIGTLVYLQSIVFIAYQMQYTYIKLTGDLGI